MTDVAPSGQLLVSIQALGHPDTPEDGHLAAGILVDPDRVLVPGPSPVADPEREFEVLLFAASPHWDRPVERIRPVRVETFRDSADPSVVLWTLIGLARPSVHAPMVGRVSGGDVDPRSGGPHAGLAAALVAAGLVDAVVLERPSAEVWQSLVRVERAQRRPLRRDVPVPPDWGWCDLLPFCDPCPRG